MTFRIALPSDTFTSNSESVYVQIRAPLTYEWVALGEGSQMAGSNMFVLYTSSANNITLSPRLSTGHSQPTLNPDAQITLLGGTGVIDGYMVANVLCENCTSWKGGSLDLTSPSTNWIWAYKKGNPLDSNNKAADIARHDSTGRQSVNMAQARFTSLNTSNPFAEYNSTTTATSTPLDNSASSSSLPAHGYIMAAAFVILFPLSAVSLHVIPYSKTVLRVHAPLQMCALALAIAGAGVGISLGVDTGKMDHYHSIIGLVAVAGLLFFQPAMGIIQHLHFRKTDGKLFISHIHRWLGRIMIVLGVANGGLGLLLSRNMGHGGENGAVVAYSAVAGIVGAFYVGVLGWRILSGIEREENKEMGGSDADEQLRVDNQAK
ncbi:hypothetical protein MAP00_005360 [Monascus purpureus]|nr:hypothetical protein MAP00_005360 [Monascus purpureus]